MTGTALRVEGLHVRIPRGGQIVHAVNGASLDLISGQVTALVGESGSGKSMTARAVLGILPPRASATGRILLGDEELLGAGERRLRRVRGRQVAIVLQDAAGALSPYLTLGAHFREALRAHRGRVAGTWRDVARRALARAGFADAAGRLDAYPFELSGGEQQRVALALAVALGPRVLLADEITSSLDVTTQAQVLERLRLLAHEQGMAVLLVTHDLAVAGVWADRLAVMYGGTVVERGPVDLVLGSPRHPYTAALVACQPSLDAGDHLVPIPGRAETLTAPLAGCPFAGRCRDCTPDCEAAVPALVGAEHAVACWRR